MDKNNAILERLKGNVTEKCRACGEYYTVIDSNMKICTLYFIHLHVSQINVTASLYRP